MENVLDLILWVQAQLEGVGSFNEYVTHFELTSSRHRYEVNPEFVSKFEAAGMKFVGQDEKNVRMEVRSIDFL